MQHLTCHLIDLALKLENHAYMICLTRPWDAVALGKKARELRDKAASLTIKRPRHA